MNNIELASYSDDNTPYAVGNNIEKLIIKLQSVSKTLFQWFSDNQMKTNSDKFHLFVAIVKFSSYNFVAIMNLVAENIEINNRADDRLLGVKIDSKLSFNTHIDDIRKKAGLKLNALSRIAPRSDFKKLLINAFFMSQFNYCQLIWMCHNRIKNIIR